jgi:hypothetical protein
MDELRCPRVPWRHGSKPRSNAERNREDDLCHRQRGLFTLTIKITLDDQNQRRIDAGEWV